MPSPTFDRSLLLRLAELARLHVPPERQTEMLQNMQRVTAAFDALRDLPAAPIDTDDAPPLALRVDVAEPPLPLADVLANAPQVAAGMFVVPRVVEG